MQHIVAIASGTEITGVSRYPGGRNASNSTPHIITRVVAGAVKIETVSAQTD
jgi:hypothetical protein